MVAHGILCVIGFLFLLPAGALFARYLRTFVPGPVWFKGHAFIQFFIGELYTDLYPIKIIVLARSWSHYLGWCDAGSRRRF